MLRIASLVVRVFVGFVFRRPSLCEEGLSGRNFSMLVGVNNFIKFPLHGVMILSRRDADGVTLARSGASDLTGSYRKLVEGLSNVVGRSETSGMSVLGSRGQIARVGQICHLA